MKIFSSLVTSPTSIPELFNLFYSLLESNFRQGVLLSQEEFQHSLQKFFVPRGPPEYVGELANDWWNNMSDWTFLKAYAQDSLVREIILHTPTCLQVEKEGSLFNVVPGPPGPLSYQEFQLALEILCWKNQITWNYSQPYTSFSLSWNSFPWRATLIHEGITPHKKSKLFLRKFTQQSWPLKEFIGEQNGTHGSHESQKSHEQKFIESLESLISDKKNLIICGATSSGKTSLLQTLLQLISPGEHIIILEDTYEIFSTYEQRTHLLSSSIQTQGQAQVQNPGKSLQDLCTYSLRLRPDRLLLGEIRGSEIIPFFLNMNTGHRGTMATLHADSARGGLERLALLFQLYHRHQGLDYSLCLDLICRNLDVVIFMEKKKIKEIVRVLGADQGKAYVENLN